MSPELPGPEGYCSSQLIPYLGNKRALLPRLLPVFRELAGDRRSPSFLDPFAGSGSVSRLARAMGMAVSSNDWEPYSKAINDSWIAMTKPELDDAFGGEAGLRAVYADWNSMHPDTGLEPSPLAEGEPYMAAWYAPELTAAPRLGTERLFYTAENAAFLDRVRRRLDAEYPASAGGAAALRRRALMGSLLLEASVHANTSGVFKAYHRGFGGLGRDALKRILGRMELEAPILPEANPGVVGCEDAAAFLRRRSADIAYIDPPYNQHQYGSNYHILNTVLRWDGEPVPLDLGSDGRLARKAGIPPGWKATWSPYCGKNGARASLAGLLDACDAAALVVSWNATGNLSAGEMLELLAPRGRLDVRMLDYVSYRGGRQCSSRDASSVEYLFIVDTTAPASDVSGAASRLERMKARRDALSASYDPERVRRVFGEGEAGLRIFSGGDGRKPAPTAADSLEGMEDDEVDELLARLLPCRCASAVEELEAMLAIMRRDPLSKAARAARREAPRCMRKLAHRKYKREFDRLAALFRDYAAAAGDAALAGKIAVLEELARNRQTIVRGNAAGADSAGGSVSGVNAAGADSAGGSVSGVNAARRRREAR